MLVATDLLSAATARLHEAGVPRPDVDAALLLAHVTGTSRLGVRLLREVDPAAAGRFQEFVARRAGREPLQHITGLAPFRHLELLVGPGVFVPRPETELLVDEVLRFARHSDVTKVVDLCAGSTAISLAVATELGLIRPGREPGESFESADGATRGESADGGAPAVTVWAVEIDQLAAQWAERNLAAHKHLVERGGAQVVLVREDAGRVAELGLCRQVGLIDVVVSNPPYVPDNAVPREAEVRDFDPAAALYAGTDGLGLIRRIVGQASQLLRPGGLVAIEHADCQGEQAGALGVPALLRAGGFVDVVDHPDLAGLPRYTTGRWPGHSRTSGFDAAGNGDE